MARSNRKMVALRIQKMRTTPTRSKIMAAIRGSNTGPELRVRSVAHRMGLRYRLHSKNLPGRPDLVFPRHRKVIFVHGCFWHRHSCRNATVPKSNTSFWVDKFVANQARDKRIRRTLTRLGWKVLVIWECQTRSPEQIRQKLERFFQ